MSRSFWQRLVGKPLVGRWTIDAVRERAVIVWREGGLKHLWFKVLGETVYRRAYLMQYALADPLPASTPAVTIEIGHLGDTEVDDYLALRPDADPVEIRARLAAGQRCVVAREDGKVVHALW